jgi:hypothetical protein
LEEKQTAPTLARSHNSVKDLDGLMQNCPFHLLAIAVQVLAGK